MKGQKFKSLTWPETDSAAPLLSVFPMNSIPHAMNTLLPLYFCCCSSKRSEIWKEFLSLQSTKLMVKPIRKRGHVFTTKSYMPSTSRLLLPHKFCLATVLINGMNDYRTYKDDPVKREGEKWRPLLTQAMHNERE